MNVVVEIFWIMYGFQYIFCITKINYVQGQKITIKTILEYQDLPFGDHPWDEFRVRIKSYMNCFGFKLCGNRYREGYYKEFCLFSKLQIQNW